MWLKVCSRPQAVQCCEATKVSLSFQTCSGLVERSLDYKSLFWYFSCDRTKNKVECCGKAECKDLLFDCCACVLMRVCVCLWWFLSVSLSLAEDYSEGPLAWAVVGITAYALHSPTNPLLGCLLSQIQTEDLTQDLTAALTLCLSASHCDLSADLLLGSLHKSSLKTNGFLTAGAKHMLVCTHTADKHERCMCWLYIRFPSECFIIWH